MFYQNTLFTSSHRGQSLVESSKLMMVSETFLPCRHKCSVEASLVATGTWMELLGWFVDNRTLIVSLYSSSFYSNCKGPLKYI
jgi:hypothetical protein